MNAINTERMTVRMPKDFVVFLIGMRINKWWRPDLWMPVALAMPRMVRELERKPEAGLLGYQFAGASNPSVMIQYWESPEHLFEYARSQDGEHFPAWVKFKRNAAKSGAVGIWHETYKIKRDSFECIYHNMPAYGLGRVGELVPARGMRKTAKQRLGAPVAA
jgi:hypothetical protein